jgi:CheY-like chemotaxis protein
MATTTQSAGELLRKLQGMKDRPLIFVLSEDTSSFPHKLDPKVVTMVVAKPFDPDELRGIIRQTLINLVAVAGEDTLRDLDHVAPTEQAVGAADVLVVDDDRVVQNLIVATLRREGLAPETANDGAQAIEKLQSTKYCAVILDLMMPKMSGWDVIDWLKKNPDKVPYSVIVSTAADRNVLTELEPDIVNAIFVKPFNTSELAAYVKACSNLSSRDRRRKRLLGADRQIQR